MAEVVADATVLIALAQIGRLPLLERLFAKLVIPPTVAREVSPSLQQLPGALRAAGFRLRQHVYQDVLRAAGESEPEA